MVCTSHKTGIQFDVNNGSSEPEFYVSLGVEGTVLCGFGKHPPQNRKTEEIDIDLRFFFFLLLRFILVVFFGRKKHKNKNLGT